MRIKLDENLPVSLSSVLAKLGHDVDTVLEEGIQGKDDDVVWAVAQQNQRLLITQDLDFSDLRKFVFGSHYGIIVVRLKEPGRLALSRRIDEVFRMESVEEWQNCFIVITDYKVRVRRQQA